jgi:transcriptional regulator with XRE-family HTH domain
VANDLGDNLRRLRVAKGVSQQDVADAVGLKKPGPISEYENGTRKPGPKRLRQLASYFGVRVDEIGAPWTKRAASASEGLIGVTKPPIGSDNSSERRDRDSTVDRPAEVGKIPNSPQQQPTTTEGPMSDQVRRLEGALLLLPEQHRESFVRKISLIAAQMLIDLEGPGVTPGKRKRASGEG